MEIDTGCKVTSFADAENGALLMSFLHEHKVVRGLKAYNDGPNETRTNFFVTLGPFVSRHGNRPVVYGTQDLSAALVVDVSHLYHLVPLLRPEGISIRAGGGSLVPGELLLLGDEAFLTVANFGRAGTQEIVVVDVATGEITDLPKSSELIAVSCWAIRCRDGASSTGFDFEFAADSEA
jgi:hypothetical protein